MPKRNSTVHTIQSGTFRRSQRLLDQKNTSKSHRLNNVVGIDGYCSVRRSSRICNQKDVGEKHKHRKHCKGKFDNRSVNCANLSSGSTKYSSLNNGADWVQSLRRSQRILSKENTAGELDKNGNSSKCSEHTECGSDDSTRKAHLVVSHKNKDVNSCRMSAEKSRHLYSGRRCLNWCLESLHRIALIKFTLTI
ncbi:Homeodomain-like [Quillaja saponaria]|uniref:Homeodomain-like n=1 Tax=Quillaja saponaria TaxID=32244 RepID=A0AAD7L9Y0_QUISA|nr:Homeodomain-like [Quillaja saponaria]